ncbi:Uncharacterised protein [Segatella copri]|nr:Uncharacterised protein [Segatella copri]
MNRWVRILKAFALPSKCVISSQNSDETIDFIFCPGPSEKKVWMAFSPE